METERFEEVLPRLQFGLGIVDISTRNEFGNMKIVHIALYMQEPDQQDKDELLKEVSTDESFGLTKIADKLDVVDLPGYMIENLLRNVLDGNVEIDAHNTDGD